MAPHMGGDELDREKPSSRFLLCSNSCCIHCHFFCCTLRWKVLFDLLAASLLLRSFPACLFFLSSNFLIQHHDLSAGAAKVLPWQMHGTASRQPDTDCFMLLPKTGWNSSITIGIDGQWFEMEREEHAQPPRPYVYVLRPAPPGKILRGYQEYDIRGALRRLSHMKQRRMRVLLEQKSSFHFCRYGLQSKIRSSLKLWRHRLLRLLR